MGGSSNSSPTTDTTTNNQYTTNTTNKNTPVGAKTTTGPAAAGYKSTFNITTKTGGTRLGLAAINATAAEGASALSFAQSVGKADLQFLTTAGGQIIGLAGKKIQTATQAATGTATTTVSKSRDLLIVGALALAGLVAMRGKR